MNNDTIINDNIEISTPANDGGLMDLSYENIMFLGERAEKIIDSLNRAMDAALKITNELDWVLIGGKPYLQESGSTKVARLFGISVELIGAPTVTVDNDGYKTYTYKARFTMRGQFIDCEGSRSMKDDFFAKRGSKTLSPDEIDERDVKMAAYTNCVNNGIKRMIPNLRNIDVQTLERAGLEVKKIQGYTFKDGTKGGASKAAEDTGLVCSKCGKGVSQKVASYSQSKYNAIYCMDCQKGASSDVEM